jgi:hypothetical protein
MEKEMVMTSFTVPSGHITGGAHENHEKAHSE